MLGRNSPDGAPDSAPPALYARRHPLAFVASVAAHALILAALVFLLPQVERPHQWVMAYLLDTGSSGGSGGGGGGHAGDAGAVSSSASLAASHVKSHFVISSPKPHPHRAAHPQATPARASLSPPAAIAATPASGDAAIAASKSDASAPRGASASAGTSLASATGIGGGINGGSGGSGSGTGSGDGSGSGSGAHAEYGQNPGPEYPIEARRRAQEGTVVLRVEVGRDGGVERVEVAHSSGFDLLDDSAIDTVRSRWRFVPAQRDGVAVESWVQVPIRFALTEARAN